MEEMKLYGKVPYIVRRPDEGHLSVKDVEHILREAFSKHPDPSFPSIPEMQNVFIDNKNGSDLHITVYKNCDYPEEPVYFNAEDADGNSYGTIVISFEESTEEKPNIVKATCKELGLTYKELAEIVGYKPDTVNKSASTGKISEQLAKAIEMYLENVRLKEQLQDYDNLKTAIKKAIS